MIHAATAISLHMERFVLIHLPCRKPPPALPLVLSSTSAAVAVLQLRRFVNPGATEGVSDISKATVADGKNVVLWRCSFDLKSSMGGFGKEFGSCGYVLDNELRSKGC